MARFHFLDETGLRLDYCRQYARAPGGQRVGQPVPLTRGRSLMLIGALPVQGLGAVQLLEGGLNYTNFAWYVIDCLGPTLQRGDVLVLDNLSVHKLPGVVDWLAERGVEVVFLPSPRPTLARLSRRGASLK
ncbi:transposase [Hymenobacter sp. NST-14]|nr:transposase [Hymenobacter piscis]